MHVYLWKTIEILAFVEEIFALVTCSRSQPLLNKNIPAVQQHYDSCNWYNVDGYHDLTQPHARPTEIMVLPQITKAFVSTSIRHRSDTITLDRCLIDVDTRAFTIWDVNHVTKRMRCVTAMILTILSRKWSRQIGIPFGYLPLAVEYSCNIYHKYIWHQNTYMDRIRFPATDLKGNRYSGVHHGTYVTAIWQEAHGLRIR